jgi:hypothetical protein
LFFVALISCSERISSKSNLVVSASFVLAENGQSLIDKDPDQPAAKGAFVFEAWRIARRSHPAVFDSTVGSFRTAENSTSDEVQQLVTTPESLMKSSRIFVPPVCRKEIVRHKSPNIRFPSRRTARFHLPTIFKNKKWKALYAAL